MQYGVVLVLGQQHQVHPKVRHRKLEITCETADYGSEGEFCRSDVSVLSEGTV